LLIAGCDAGTRTNDEDTPPPEVRVVGVLAYDDNGKQIELARAPTKTVIADTSFRVQVDRFLLPVPAIRQAICVQREIRPTVLESCLEPESFAVTYDPARREIVYRPSADAGDIVLVQGGVYQLTVFPSVAKDDPNAIHAFDGALTTGAVFEFKVSSKTPSTKNPTDPPPDPKKAWCGSGTDGVSGIFSANCAVGGCHVYARNTDGSLQSAPMGLQLGIGFQPFTDEEVVDVVRRTAINHVAHETQIGENADEAEAAPDRFGRAMPIIDDKSPGNSYLLYKLLIGKDGDTNAWFISDEAERQRLRDAFVVDDAMPLLNKPGGAVKMTTNWLETLSEWSESGAQTPDCD
jgi:hypothetical protein